MRACAAVAALAVALLAQSLPSLAAAPPRLVVLLAIDQLRPDRLDASLPGGLGRLAREGRVYTEAVIDHAQTATCPGHVSMLTGVHPARAGIAGNTFFDLEKGQVVYCVADDPVTATVLGEREKVEGRSPRMMSATTLGDWLKAARPGSRVFSASGKDRAAITLAGQGPDGVYWFDRDASFPRFTTSRHYRDALPDWLEAWNGTDPPRDGFLARVPERWEHAIEPAMLEGRIDDFQGEARVHSRVTPHPVRARDGKTFARQLATSPWLDAATLELAEELVRREELGRGPGTDLLTLGLSGTDLIGHLYGPFSHESKDALRRLDEDLGRFLRFAEERAGKGRVLVALTADHGVLSLPEWNEQGGPDPLCPVEGGRVSVRGMGLGLLTRIHFGFSPLSLPRRWLLFAGAQIAVDRPLAAAREQAPAEVAAYTAHYLERQAVIEEVWTAAEIQTGSSEMARLYRNSFVPGRSGDLIVQVAAGCLLGDRDEGTTHGTPYLYDRAVPLVFWGPGIEPASVSGPAATIDIAPTLAPRLGLETPADLDGRRLF